MTTPTEKKCNGETHTACKARLDKEGGKSRCCYCVPHEGCDFDHTKSSTIEEIVGEFEEKTTRYDKDGGFIVYVEGYDNTDFDVAEMELWLRAALQNLQTQTREEVLDEVEAALPLYNRWDDKSTEGYKKNSAVEDPETGRNAVLKEIRAALQSIRKK